MNLKKINVVFISCMKLSTFKILLQYLLVVLFKNDHGHTPCVTNPPNYKTDRFPIALRPIQTLYCVHSKSD